MNDQQPVRIGLVGAGAIFRDRHLPNLKTLPQVRMVTVTNRSEASSRRVAEQFGIEGIDSSWQSLLAEVPAPKRWIEPALRARFGRPRCPSVLKPSPVLRAGRWDLPPPWRPR